MKKILFIILLCPLFAAAQTIGHFRYDTTKFYKNGGNNELYIQNATRAVTGGVFTNQGNGLGAWVLPTSSDAWKLLGNSGTTAGTNFIGTTDSVDLVIKVNGDENTRITPLGGVNIIDAAGKRQLTFDPSNMYWALGDWAGDFGNATSIHIADSTGEVRIDGFITLQELKNDDPSLAVNDFYPVFYNDNSQAITAGSGVDSIWRPSADSIRFRVRSSIVGKGGTFGIYAPTATGGIAGLTTNELVYGNSATTIASLPVATYPSLTELSYVKGVTSGIQAQIDGKANTALSNLASVAINTSLISDANNTDDLGSASTAWRTAYMGTSAFVPLINGSSAANGDITIEGTSDATKTTSYVNLQTTGGKVGIGQTAPSVQLHITEGALNNLPPTLGTASGMFSMTANGNLYGMFQGVMHNTGSGWLQAMRRDGTGTAYALLLNPSGGNVSIQGGATTPTAKLHIIGAGTTTAGTAPFKLTTGTSMTAAEAGAMEYTTPQLFFTNGAAVRQELFQGQQSRVSTQFDKTSDAALANITGLTANVAAGKTYRFEAKLYTTSNVAGGVKAAIAGTATATAIVYEGLTTDAGLITQARSTALAGAVGAVTAVTAGYIVITGTIRVANAGTLTVQFAQNASNGTASSVLIGSTFVVTEML